MMRQVIWRELCGVVLAVVLALVGGVATARTAETQEIYCPDVVLAIYWTEQAWLSCIESGGGSACYDTALPILNELNRILDEHECSWDR